MYLFFTDAGNIGGTAAQITGPDVNHIKNVLRMKPGDIIRVCDGGGACYICRITALEPERVTCDIIEKDENGTELPASTTILQGIPKGDKMEFVIQKNVELGINTIVPVQMARSVVHLDAQRAQSKQKRWQAIALSAAKQSKRTAVPAVELPQSFKAAVDGTRGYDLKILPYENEVGIESARRIIERVEPGMSIAFIIGPEGGFEPEEVAYAEEAGYERISLGRRILRTETAGMVLMSAIMMKLEQ